YQLELPDWPMILRVQHFVWIQPLLHLEIRAWNFNLSYLIEYIKIPYEVAETFNALKQDNMTVNAYIDKFEDFMTMLKQDTPELTEEWFRQITATDQIQTLNKVTNIDLPMLIYNEHKQDGWI
ncbi:hypothetical protein ACJX0J_037296, partial [Zea mays]